MEKLNDPESIERRRRKRELREQRESERQQRLRLADWEALISHSIGERYRHSRLDTFDTSEHPSQAEAVGKLTEFADRISDHVSAGDNLLLHGPVGTGKDDLLTAVLHAAVMAGHSVKFVNGMDLFQRILDAMRSNGSVGHLLNELQTADVLALSDPIPPAGENAAYQLQALFSVIDHRYRRLRPTFVTMNVADRDEANRRMAPQIIDRIGHNALTIHCNWPSYRKPLPRLHVARETRTA